MFVVLIRNHPIKLINVILVIKLHKPKTEVQIWQCET